MKKLLAICLSVFMVISLMPAVFAADVDPETFESGSVVVPASGKLTVQAEDYLSVLRGAVYEVGGSVTYSIKTGTKTAIAGKDGEYYLRSAGAPTGLKTGSTTAWILAFTVPADGYYRIETSHGGRVQYENAYAMASIDDDTQLFNVTANTTPAGKMIINDNTTYLTAGKHTYKYVIGFESPNINLYLDYVSFEKMSSEFDVASAGATTIQAESYPYTTCVHSDATTHVVEGTVASGVVTSDCTTHTDANGKNNWNISLNVAATGVYEIKTVAGGALDANGGVEIVLDGETIITDTEVSTEAETFAKSVYLTAGVHTYTYAAKSVSGKATATIDYVEVTPVLAGSADPDTTGTPVITPPTEVLIGSSVAVSYTYAEGNTNPEGNSILRVLYNDAGTWRIDTTKTVTGGTGSIDLPNHLVGYEVAVEFIPVDSTGKMGPVTSSVIGTLSRPIGTSAAAITPSGSNINATVTITNNSATSGPQNICVILVQYDADGAMLAVTNATVSVENGTPQTLTPSFAKETGAAKVQMFVWDGTGYLDAGVSTYGTPVTYMVP